MGEWVTGDHIVSLISLLFLPMWAFTVLMLWRSRGSRVWLRDLPAVPQTARMPTLGVVVAARNEAGGIRQALASLLAQDYPHLRITVVNDRSDDSTGAILDEMAARDPRLNVVHVTSLPEGWLGKNHALQRGYEQGSPTSMDFVLFTDADVVFPSPTLLRRVVHFAERSGIDHVTVLPDVPPDNFAERLFLMIFNIAFSVKFPVWAVHSRRLPVAMGVGAFNLVRRRALASIGGLTQLKLSIDDDMRLGQALKFSGYRPQVTLGLDEVVVKWQSGLWGYVKGLEKNFYASLDFNILNSVGAIVGLMLMTCSGWLFVLAATWTSVLASMANMILIAMILKEGHRQSRVSPWYALLLPLGGLVLNIAHVNSLVRTLVNDGVIWRNHHYHLAELRAHVRERNRWLRDLWKSRRKH